ncbi:hypothetical protein WJX84_003088 [Apatococcus fuscideae]|uniref:Inositol-1,3,4-trisphosphate 5/6-kinase n=1 Tax=Apatococcus fuscideae TaxID=2026836 RepID=A0AAW1T2C3_9CHLO
MAHSRGAPLTHARAHLAKWPFTAFEVVASERLLCQTLRQVADGLGTAPEHTALCGRLPHIQLSQAWRAINGRLPILESLHGLESTAQKVPPDAEPLTQWLALPKYVADSHTGPGLLRVGVVMKHGRQLDFSERGLLPLVPTDGVILTPLDLMQPMAVQGPLHALLHKATDLPHAGSGLTWPDLEQWIDLNPDVLVVDALWAVKQVTSRAFLIYLASQAKRMNLPFGFPAAMLVEDWAHDLAIIRNWNALGHAQVRMPGILQEYIEHSSVLYKVYVAGAEVTVTSHASTPDLASLPPCHGSSSVEQLIEFNSLDHIFESEAHSSSFAGDLPPGLAQQAADFLRSATHLSLFGFDMVIQNVSGDVFIVDVNYFPSYRNDSVSIPLLASYDGTQAFCRLSIASMMLG